MLRFFAERYDRRSLVAFTLLVTTAVAVGYRWSDLLDVSGGMDWLLAGTWLLMAALLAWNVRAKKDLLLFAVGACGGFVIEWWGTNTELWSYFTAERPPLWILPAWPIAALTIDRIAQVYAHGLDVARRLGVADPSERAFRIVYQLMLPAFVVALFVFVWPRLTERASLVVMAIVLYVAVRCPKPRRDVLLFLAGSSLGILLEYWGTSRQCWTYYTREVPPPVAIFAHGFASVAFARVYDVAERALERLARFFGRIPEALEAVD